MEWGSAIGWVSRYFLFLDGEITLQFRSDWSMTILSKSYSVYDKSRHLCRFVLERYKFLGEKGIPKATDYVIVYSFVCANCNDESSLLCSRWIIFFNNQAPYFDSAAVISELSQETSQYLIVRKFAELNFVWSSRSHW